MASLFSTLVVNPIFNLLVIIYALLPGHNFGLSIILFTIVVRLLMTPLVKRQLHQAKVMRELQPELKRIKKAATNKQQESAMLMELYKERGISPFGSIGTLAIQLVILIGLYSGLQRVVKDPQAVVDMTYSWVQNLPWIKDLAGNIGQFDATLLGFIDLSKPALENGVVYWPAMALVLGSAVAQFFQSKQLLPNNQDNRSLRTILKEAGSGKQAEQSEVNAAVGQSTRYILPVFIVLFTVGIASALSLYWLTTGIVAYIQQARILKQDETEMEGLADGTKTVIEGEVVDKPKPKNKANKKKSSGGKKRRKK